MRLNYRENAKGLLAILCSIFLIWGLSDITIAAQEEETEEETLVTQETTEAETTPFEDSIDSTSAIDEEQAVDPVLQIQSEEESIQQVKNTPNGWNQSNTQYYRDGVAVNGVQKIDEDYYYFENRMLSSFTGFVNDKSNGSWVFVRRGKSDWNFTGLAKSSANNKWYFSRKGMLDWNFTGVAKSIANNQWYHAKNGRLDWGFTGFSKSVANGNWYVSYNGKLNWNYTGVAKSVANGEWYHAKNGRLDWGFTGISKSYLTKKWYFSRRGKLDWNYTGGAQSVTNGNWYYVKRGRWDQSFNGKAKGTNGKTYTYKRGAATINYIYTKNGTRIYMEGIDISQWNGHIDLNQYKKNFVIIRVAYGPTIDPLAKRNMDLCEALGIPYGVYLYSYALNTADAVAEANFLLDVIKGRNIQVGVWYDMEDADNYKRNNNAFSGALMTQMCNTFCSIVQSRGYYTGIYSSANWFTSYLPGTSAYPWWVAHWGVNDGKLNVDTSHMGPIQQFTSTPLDRNVLYKPLSYFRR